LISILCLVLMTLKRQWRAAPLLVAGGLLHMDLPFYTIFPLFFNAPHLYFFGGTRPEPIDGLVEMGLSQFLAVTLVLLVCAIQLCWLWLLLKRKRREDPSIPVPLN